MVNHIETLRAVGVIYGRNIHQGGKLAGGVRFQEFDKTRYIGRRDINVKLIIIYI